MKDIKQLTEKLDTFDRKKKLPKKLQRKLKTIDDWFDIVQQFDQCFMDALPFKLANLIENTSISEEENTNDVVLEVLSQLCLCVIKHLENKELPSDCEIDINNFIEGMHEELSVALDETLNNE